jgi:phosphatidylcholine synthase
MTHPRVRGYLVHGYTLSTTIFAVFGMHWILAGHYPLALLAMAATVMIDASDGALARRYRVWETAPGIDGPLLDNVVDYFSYVVLPILFLLHAGLLPAPAPMFAAAIALSAAYGFARSDAKQSDEAFFVGFPSYWNVVAFYLYLLQPPALLTGAVVVTLAALAFSNLRFLYPTRLRAGRSLHLILGSAWGIALTIAILLPDGPERSALALASLAYVAFYAIDSIARDRALRRRVAHGAGD